MSATSRPRIYTFKADASIDRGRAVKLNSSDGQHVAVCTATTDLAVGISQGSTTASGDFMEVAIQGGGAKALLGGTVSKGNLLVATTDGSLIKASASGDQLIAEAMQDGVSGDIIAVEVIRGQATAAQS
jgi:hypothetical protein